jgi:hypothetical protein
VIILGGLSGGDSELRILLLDSGVGRGAACSKTKTAEAARSRLRGLETATTGGDKACLQHECEAGMPEVSHMLAIFKQQLCSSSVTPRPGDTQARSGCPISSSISAAATILEPLLNIVILPHHPKDAFNVAFPGPVTAGKGDLALNSLLLLISGFGHVLVQPSLVVHDPSAHNGS